MIRLKELRDDRGLTQEKLAKELTLSRSTIAMYETNKSEPDITTLQLIASYFDVSVDFLINNKQENNMNKFKELRKKAGLTQIEFAQKLNVDQSTISKWEQDKAIPDIQMLVQLASFFNVSVDYLMGREQKVDNNVAGVQLERQTVRIPVYGTIPAGVPIEMIEDSYIEDYEDISADLLRGGNKYFALRVKGDSMLPKFESGDILILKQTEDCESGAYCAVSINHTECTFKKVIKKMNGLTLMPLNPDYEPLFFTNREVAELPVTILGVVKEVRRSY